MQLCLPLYSMGSSCIGSEYYIVRYTTLNYNSEDSMIVIQRILLDISFDSILIVHSIYGFGRSSVVVYRVGWYVQEFA